MRKDSGFTLVELLAVVAIIGILAATAIPQFNSYRRRSFDGRTVADLRNAATSEEGYFALNQHYVDCIGAAACKSILGSSFVSSPGVDIAMFQIPASGALPESFTGRAFHAQGTRSNLGTAFMWNSNLGGLQ